jgi:cell division protease FtsH
VESAHVHATDILSEHQSALEKLAEILIKRETIERPQFEALLDGRTEAEIFDAEAPPPREVPVPPSPASRPGRKGPRALPRPGLAGGAAD